MLYYSTNNPSSRVCLNEAIIKGLAQDNGLFMPVRIEELPNAFFKRLSHMTFQEIAFDVSKAFFGEDIPQLDLKRIIEETLNFEIPLVPVTENIFALELFHGPTLAFKDVGARFMARILGYFVRKSNEKRNVNVLVATSGDTGSAVANGFLGVKGVHVYVLYPKGKVSEIQEKQFTTLGTNITAVEVDGTFDDCQNLVKQAFLDKELNQEFLLTSANSINVARFLPQTFYYFYIYAQLKKLRRQNKVVISVPSGNLGNLTAGLIAKRMGLPIHRFIAANNRNDVFSKYLETGKYTPRSSELTIANAMDVGNPSNFARILDLYDDSHEAIIADIRGAVFMDEEIRAVIKRGYDRQNYILDPHGACAYGALQDGLLRDELGVFLATAHPAKFKTIVEPIVHTDIEIPDRLSYFMNKMKVSVATTDQFEDFKSFLFSSAE